MGSELLDIDPAESTTPEVLYEMEEGMLRGIVLQVKHALSRERPLHRNTVNSADQSVTDPGFCTVGEPHLMESDVGFLHLRGDPGLFLTRSSALLNDRLKRCV